MCSSDLEGLQQQRNVVIEGDIPESTPLVKADEMRLKEVLVNFLSNAIKYSAPEGGKVWVSAKTGPAEVVISVSNNGPAISDEDKEHVFQKFWRSDSAKKGGQE